MRTALLGRSQLGRRQGADGRQGRWGRVAVSRIVLKALLTIALAPTKWHNRHMARLADLPTAMLSESRYWFSFEEALAGTGRSAAAVQHGLARLVLGRQLISPARGFYVIVPPEFRIAGSPPLEWFVDPMMEHLRRRYYVGLLSAAAVHGASHQAPQVFQVVVNSPVRDRVVGRTRLQFISSTQVEATPFQRVASHTGFYHLSTPEATVVDCVAFPRHAGGLDNVATIAKDIGHLDSDALASVGIRYADAVRHRLGWILSQVRPDIDLQPLHKTLASNRTALLEPRASQLTTDKIDETWGVRINVPLEAET